MADNAAPRKLATIVAGYSARTEADEAKTTAEVAALHNVIEAIAARHGGRMFKGLY
jgi:class 3 adenylate cyclase